MEIFLSLLLLSPFLKLRPYDLSFTFAQHCHHIFFLNIFDRSDRVHKLKHERSPSLQHPHINVFPASSVELDLNLLFLPTRIHQWIDSILDLLLETSFC